MTPPLQTPAPPARREPPPSVKRRGSRGVLLRSHGEPAVWLTAGALVIALLMIAGLLVLVFGRGLATFWPQPVVRFETLDGEAHLGEVERSDLWTPTPADVAALPEAVREGVLETGEARRRLVRTGNFEETNRHFRWIADHEIAAESEPEWALVLERLTWGRLYGVPAAFEVDGEVLADEPAAVWELFREHHEDVRERWRRKRELETDEIGDVNHVLEDARLDVRMAERSAGEGSPAHLRAQERYAAAEERATAEFAEIREEIRALEEENERYRLVLSLADGGTKDVGLAEVVRAFPANRLGLTEKVGVYVDRWAEFLFDDPREANSEGGVWPAIFGTVVMTLIMTVLVVPFGVLAALYLREYAKQGAIVAAVRIAINNLAGVPSIVFGVFGLGFFCYIVGAEVIDPLVPAFAAKLPNPTFGKGGILWAALTLALLTLPVVIVATEEALSAVPNSMREGSFACGATRWQTIRRIVLPRAAPGIMTGAILAIARGAGEVAPLMLVGAVKLAPELPVEGRFPFVFPQRSFMHLGFHIYDLGFQSQNSEAAKPMVFTTTLLLIAIVVFLNLFAIWVRARLRRRFQ